MAPIDVNHKASTRWVSDSSFLRSPCITMTDRINMCEALVKESAFVVSLFSGRLFRDRIRKENNEQCVLFVHHVYSLDFGLAELMT